MKTWEEYQKETNNGQFIFENRAKTGVACPKCGREIWRRTDVVLTTYPVKYQYECACGWTGTAYK